MKPIRFILSAMLLVLASNLFGDELVIQNFTIMPGETKTVSIELNNPENPYILLEFEVIFPEGISIAKDEDDELLVELNSDRIAKSHTLEVADHGGGKYKFLVYSSKNAAFKGISGEIISVTLTASDDAANGEFQGRIIGQLFSKEDETGYYPDDKSFMVNIKGEENITVIAKDYSRLYGEANPTFEYAVEGGTLDGTPNISCEATATSPVGIYPIVVSKGTETNGSVTYVAGTLTINKAPLIISGGTYTMKQGDALPELKAEYSGFKNGETEAVLTKKPALTTIATSASAPGEYEVTVSGAEAQNYEISYEHGKITVIQADAVIITASSYTIKYGDALPKFGYTSEGAALTGTPEISCSATASSPVGTYDIVIEKGSVTNYNVTYVKGTLTITKAPLIISGGTYTMKQGDALPELKAEYSGFKNGETEAVLTKKPALTTTATSASAPGEYEVTVSGAEAQNYEISYEHGKITVTQADPGGNDDIVLTNIIDGSGQPPIVGGRISDDFSLENVMRKGIILGINEDEMYIDENTAFKNAFFEPTLTPESLRFYDCTDLNERQFNIPLRVLNGNRQYYVKAYVIDKDGTVYYGNVESLTTQAFNRKDDRYDRANVWYAFSATLFDLVTDEIIDPSTDGFYYSTNENPKTCRYQKGTGYNTCYKFATEWNYKLWYYHNTLYCESAKVVDMPVMSYADGKLTITKNPADADKDVSIYYCVDGDYFRPENYTQLYTQPLEIQEGHYVCCYAISSDGYMSYTNLYAVTQADSGGNEDQTDDESTDDSIEDVSMAQTSGKAVVYNMQGQRVQTITQGIYIINGKKVIIK